MWSTFDEVIAKSPIVPPGQVYVTQVRNNYQGVVYWSAFEAGQKVFSIPGAEISILRDGDSMTAEALLPIVRGRPEKRVVMTRITNHEGSFNKEDYFDGFSEDLIVAAMFGFDPQDAPAPLKPGSIPFVMCGDADRNRRVNLGPHIVLANDIQYRSK